MLINRVCLHYKVPHFYGRLFCIYKKIRDFYILDLDFTVISFLQVMTVITHLITHLNLRFTLTSTSFFTGKILGFSFRFSLQRGFNRSKRCTFMFTNHQNTLLRRVPHSKSWGHCSNCIATIKMNVNVKVNVKLLIFQQFRISTQKLQFSNSFSRFNGLTSLIRYLKLLPFNEYTRKQGSIIMVNRRCRQMTF